MENKEFTPSESLAMIANIISEAKTRFKENGFSFIFIGLCCFIASLGQFILLKLEYYQINFYPYFIMPIAGVVTYFYYKRKNKNKSINIISLLLASFGALLGINLIIAGFFFWDKFGNALVPFIFILLSIWSVTTGVLLKNRIFIISGVIINIIAYSTFFIDMEYHSLILSVVSVIGIVIPGIILNYSSKVSHV